MNVEALDAAEPAPGSTERLGPRRAEVLACLREATGPQTVTQVARAVGLHVNSTRFHLDALARAGLVSRVTESRTTPGRPKVLYRATRPDASRSYLDLATVMIRHFARRVSDRQVLALAAGEAWGQEVRRAFQAADPDEEPRDRLVKAMDQLGYQPTLRDGVEPTVDLVPCPHRRLAEVDPDVVCQLHLGLARGLLADDPTWTAAQVQPWVTPTLCRVRLAQRTSGEASATR